MPSSRLSLPEQVHHLAAGARVEIARRLVGQQDRRLVGQRAGDGHALLLAAGELRGMVGRPRFQADLLQQLADALAALVGCSREE